MIVINMNAGPYKSRFWGKAKHEGGKRYWANFTCDDPCFAEVAQLWAASRNESLNTAADWQDLFDKIPHLKTLNEQGPYLKLMRWCSIHDCWVWWRGQFFGLRPVLRMLADEQSGGRLEAELHNGRTMGCVDDNIQAALGKTNNTISKAWKYINSENFWGMDLFTHVTSTQYRLYQHVSATVKTIPQATRHNITMMDGGWHKELRDTIRKSMFDPPSLRMINATHCAERRMDIFNFTCAVVKLRYEEQLF